MPSGFFYTSTSNIDATPIVWTDTTTDMPNIRLVLKDLTATGGGGTPARTLIVE
jgi:hypothetical protein